MQAKQDKLRAKLPLKLHEISKGAYSYNKPRLNTFKVIDKTTEKTIVQCYVSGNSGSKVYADLWIGPIKKSKIPKKADYTYTVNSIYDNEPARVYTSTELSGKGSASGYGYDKTSAAIGEAIAACGITLWGTPYRSHEPDFKKQCSINGTGEHEKALLAIAYACGYNNIILVSC